MKNVLMIGLMMMATQASHALYRGPDAMMTTLACKPLVMRPDIRMSVTVTQGGITGLTQIHVSQTLLNHNKKQTYTVKKIEGTRAGAPVVYRGRDVVLSVDFGTTLPGGLSRGFIQIKNDGRMISTETLACGPVYNIM